MAVNGRDHIVVQTVRCLPGRPGVTSATMSGPSRGRRIAVSTGALALALALASPAAAQPTVDPSAPTPTAPSPGGPPQGHGPDGRTVGGEELGGRGVVQPDDAPTVPGTVTAAGWLVADLGRGEVLGARDPHGRYYPASTLKLLTLLALHDQIDPATVVVGTDEDAAAEGTRVGLVTGGRYPVPLLWQTLMMASGNDSASALTRAAGGMEVALAAMNDKAGRLQAYDTVAGTPSGLDVAGQTSSPYDLALFMAQVVADPALLAIMQTPTLMMPAVPPRYPAYQIQNQNPLLGNYTGALAGKTGFTDAARHTFVGVAERAGRRLVVVLMQGEQTPVRMSDQAAALLDWGFARPADADGVGTLVAPLAPGVTPPTATRSGPATATAGPRSTYAAGPGEGTRAVGPGAGTPPERPPLVLVAVLAAGSAALLLLLLARLPLGARHR